MDFDDTPADVAFRAEARAWLAQHATPKPSDHRPTGALNQPDAEAERAHVARSKAWQATLEEAGWAGISWPAAFGGRGGTPRQQAIFNAEQAAFDVPQSVFTQGIGMAGPTLIAHGTDEQKTRFLRPMLRGDEIWCQLFSEPGAGSDLAGLSTRAERDGDDFVVNGQKVWTSSAHFSDWGILLARTDPDLPKHKGITYFLVDMRSPGIDVRPLRQISGVAHFNEVFLADVRIPAANVLGSVNEGWRVARTTLTSERIAIGSGLGGDVSAELLALASRVGRSGDPVIRQQLMKAYVHHRTITYLGWRVQTAVDRGEMPGPESSVIKLSHSRLQGELGDVAMAVLGASGMLLDYAALDASPWQSRFLTQWASRLGGGTEQVQRNIVAEQVLGLPRDVSVDRDLSFRELTSAGRS
jgi:alkylation response protein AidB-like acyl-CoA dehydrogenase